MKTKHRSAGNAKTNKRKPCEVWSVAAAWSDNKPAEESRNVIFSSAADHVPCQTPAVKSMSSAPAMNAATGVPSSESDWADVEDLLVSDDDDSAI
jgi:hypothetical protein